MEEEIEDVIIDLIDETDVESVQLSDLSHDISDYVAGFSTHKLEDQYQ